MWMSGCCLPTPMTLASGGSAILPSTNQLLRPSDQQCSHHPAGSVQKSRGDNVVRMWLQLRSCVLCYKGGIVVMDVIWRRLCVSMIWRRLCVSMI